jgi:hypothetical protein
MYCLRARDLKVYRLLKHGNSQVGGDGNNPLPWKQDKVQTRHKHAHTDTHTLTYTTYNLFKLTFNIAQERRKLMPVDSRREGGYCSHARTLGIEGAGKGLN